MARRAEGPARSSGGPAPRLPVWAVIALVLVAAVAGFVLQRGRGGATSADPRHERLPPGPTPPIPSAPPQSPTAEPPSDPSTRRPDPGARTVDVDGIGDAEERAAITAVARAIDRGGPFAYRKDGVTFENREQRLAAHPRGYWHEYTVPTPGSDDRGARRLIAGPDGELFYTDDHYRTFLRIRGPTRR